MEDLAIVFNTTDKYSHIWEVWYHYFKKYWTLDLPVYFLNERLDCPFPFKQIKVDIQGVELWTKKFRESVKQIPENNLFVLLDDLIFIDGFREGEFEMIYKYFLDIKADALRIRPYFMDNIAIRIPSKTPGFGKLHNNSPYLISWQPSIWKKETLLKCISPIDENPWKNEQPGTKRIRPRRFSFHYYEKDAWFVNVLRHGKVDPKYKHLLTIK